MLIAPQSDFDIKRTVVATLVIYVTKLHVCLPTQANVCTKKFYHVFVTDLRECHLRLLPGAKLC